MSEWRCYLVTLLQGVVGDFPPSLLKVAVKIHRDDARRFADNPGPFLPAHCLGYRVLAEETVELFEVVDHSKED